MNWNDLHRAKQFVDTLLTLEQPPRADEDLHSLREAVTAAKGQAGTPRQMGALFHLEDVLNWEKTSAPLWPFDSEIGARIKDAKGLLSNQPELHEELRRLHHKWINR